MNDERFWAKKSCTIGSNISMNEWINQSINTENFRGA